MTVVQIFLACLGRILLSLIFILTSISMMMDWQGSLQYMTNGLHALSGYMISMPHLQPLIDELISHASLTMGLALVFMFVGGLFVFFGIKTRLGAFLLIIVVIAATLTMNPFWAIHTSERELQMAMFMKNLSILGGLFYVLAFGNGARKGAKKPASAEEEK